ncbi:hypothetical protein [Paenibacillus hunanensis]|uniref:DUF4868 domain-containing protein n=1 Tax=Paenibacillus hunanensis TaxID=539262 RepID=A0ABU1IWD3_9BACL|nr:hypothetical protein [Paenibacillus hunanensis]MDR6242682.1 hypothetical protein [Paenibacillus hunanensis]GGJ01850.1 hypothetical protein GCM10008022_08570 [Paenibacillus hunanensis]
MTLQKIWVCTSKSSRLHRIYLLQTDGTTRTAIRECFEEDLSLHRDNETSMVKLDGSALIDDIPYFIPLSDIDEEEYLYAFKEKVVEILDNQACNVIHFSKNPFATQEIKDFEENEAIKFIIAQSNNSLYFLQVPSTSVIKHKLVLSMSITANSTSLIVPKGIQVPYTVTARLNCSDRTLFVYDVNKFESMLTLNENQKMKSQLTLDKFLNGHFKISTEDYTFTGLDAQEVRSELDKSIRATRRLAKYKPDQVQHSITKIKEAVDRLDVNLRVAFDDNNRTIHITAETARTFVGIIHNSIVERLISGTIEIAI